MEDLAQINWQIGVIALVGGVVPALLWLLFWIKEDKKPEPWYYLMFAFIAGMAAVPLVIPFNNLLVEHLSLSDHLSTEDLGQVQTLGFLMFLFAHFLMAGLEEVFKYGVAFFSALSTPENNERIDPIIYMIVVALGFAALENTLYILGPLKYGEGLWLSGAVTMGTLRFLGPTLLHVISSATLGLFLSFSFYYPRRRQRWLYIPLGLLAATAIHTVYNVMLLVGDQNWIMGVFTGVWLGVIILLAKLNSIRAQPEKVKAATNKPGRTPLY